MKIGFVIYGSLDTLSGGYLYDRKLVDYLRAHGDSLEIVSLPWRNYAAHLTDNLWFRLPSSDNGLRTLIRRVVVPKRTEVPAPAQLDLLLQDELNHASLLAANARGHPYPIVSLVHHLRCSESRPKWQNDFYRIMEQKYLQNVDGFIFNSETTKGAVNRVVESSKPSVVAYPPTDRFGEAISESEIIARAKREPFRILFLGNLIERKGLHTLLDALFILHAKRSSLTLDIVGSPTFDPAYTKFTQEKITANRLSSSAFLHGSLDNEPLIAKLRQAHVLVVPSSYEGFGIVYLEGMGFGLPAIGTTAGAASETIRDGETGFLVQPNDAAALASRISHLASDRDLLARLSLQARARYIRQPTWEQSASRIRAFLLQQVAAFSVQ